jgi:hypothetical protein
LWTIAFLTGTPGGDVVNHLQGDYVSVYVPTTPNPTSGFFLMMREGCDRAGHVSMRRSNTSFPWAWWLPRIAEREAKALAVSKCRMMHCCRVQIQINW